MAKLRRHAYVGSDVRRPLAILSREEAGTWVVDLERFGRHLWNDNFKVDVGA